MQIAHLIAYPLFSGPAAATLPLALAQQALGHKVTISADSKRGHDPGFEEAVIPALQAAQLQGHFGLELSSKSTLLTMWRDIRTLSQLVHQRRVDMIHVHGNHEHSLAVLAGGTQRHLRTLHNDRFLDRGWLQAWLLRQAGGLVVRTSCQADKLHNFLGRLSPPIKVIAGSLPTWLTTCSLPSSAAARRLWQLPAAAIVVGQVALLDQRGQDELLIAVNLLRDPRVHVLLVGDGCRRQQLQQLTRRLNLNHRVHFTGYLSQQQLASAYAAMDIAFLAQPGNDAAARAALEALALAVPLMAVAEGALANWVVDNRYAFQVAAKHPAFICTTLRQVIHDLAAARMKAQQAAKWVQTNYQASQEAQQTLTFYQSILG